MRQVPVAEGLFTWRSDEPHLIASRGLDCDDHVLLTSGVTILAR